MSMEDMIKGIVGQTRNEVSLHKVLQTSTTSYLVTVICAQSEADLPDNAQAWIDTFNEAGLDGAGKTLPESISSRAKTWAGFLEADSPLPIDAPGVGAMASGEILTHDAVEMNVNSTILEGLTINPLDREKALSDAKAQGISLARAVALGGSLELGRVMPLADVMAGALLYGSNPRLMEAAKAARKAGVDTLGEIVKAKDKLKFSSHMNSLLRDLGARRLTEEVALVSQWSTENQVHFDGSEKLFWSYVEEYLKVYAGRGLPVAFDNAIAMRISIFSQGKGSDEEMQKMKRELASTKGDLASASKAAAEQASAVKSLRNEFSQLKAKMPSQPGHDGAFPKPKKQGDKGNVTCFKCGKKGHIAADCEEPAKEEEE